MARKFKNFNQFNKAFRKAYEDALDGRTALKACKRTRKNVLGMVRKGKSPITGKPFPAYKPSYKKFKKRLGKRIKPVNLKLFGDFLKNLGCKRKGLNSALLGFFDKESIDKELGHRKGTNGQKKRPIIPIGKENYVPKIQKDVSNIYEAALDKALRKLG